MLFTASVKNSKRYRKIFSMISQDLVNSSKAIDSKKFFRAYLDMEVSIETSMT
jgi:hypothetical protein